jgi:hypothetical protein
MRITREVAATEVWLDYQAELREPNWPERAVSARVWAEELAKAAVWFAGVAILILLMILLAPESRGDTLQVSQISAALDAGTPIPLAQGVDTQLAFNLVTAQNKTWGRDWLDGSLTLSIESVLKVISLYVWDGGPTLVTNQNEFPIVWLQSRIAIDPRLSGELSPASINFGEVLVDPVGVPEPATYVGVVLGLVGLSLMRWRYTRPSSRMTRRMRAYRVHLARVKGVRS